MARFPFAAGFSLLLSLFSTASAQNRTNSTAKALSIPPSQYWDGNDGPWSSFMVSVGTPKQSLRLLASNTQPVPWAIDDYFGCLNQTFGTQNDGSTCKDYRGYLFKNSSSSTWDDYGFIYQLLNTKGGDQETYLGLRGNGYVGNDTFTFGWPGMEVATIKQQTMAITDGGGYNGGDVPTWLFFNGLLGLFPRPMNLTNPDNGNTFSEPSTVESLYNQGTIPSLSWGYTAGARNHDPQIYGSLTFGGYDASRSGTTNISWPFGADQSKDLLVRLKGIQTSSVIAGSTASTTILDKSDTSGAFSAMIDFTIAYIYLPRSLCTKFEQAFGLEYNETSELYFLSDAQHSALQTANPTVTFTLGSDLFSQTIDITMPYWSFDTIATYPLVAPYGAQQRYFPLKRAANDTQYVLGRAFLQSAYVTADYHRNNFTVSPALFPPNGSPQKLVTIYPPGRDPLTPTQPLDDSKRPLGTGAIVGIIVGGVAVMAIVGAAVWLLYRHRRKKSAPAKVDSDDPFTGGKAELDTTEVDPTRGKVEVDGIGPAMHEMEGERLMNELMEGKPWLQEMESPNKPWVHEMDSQDQMYEMPAEDVPRPELESPLPSEKPSAAGTPAGSRREPPKPDPVPEEQPRRERFSWEE